MRLVKPNQSEFESLFDAETRKVWVCSPWITREGVAMLTKALTVCASALEELDIWFRMTAAEAQISNFAAIEDFLDSLSLTNVKVLLHSAPDLHAKVVWTDKGALIGSMNMTKAGYERNPELAVRLEATELATQASIRDVLKVDMQRVSEFAWKRFLISLSGYTAVKAQQVKVQQSATQPVVSMIKGKWELQAIPATVEIQVITDAGPTEGKCGKKMAGSGYCNKLPGHDLPSVDADGNKVAPTACNKVPF